MREIERKRDPDYDPKYDRETPQALALTAAENKARQPQGEWQTTLADMAQVKLPSGPPEGMDDVRYCVDYLEKLMYEHIKPERYLKRGHVVESKFAAYDWEIKIWEMPEHVRNFIDTAGAWTRESMTGARKMSMTSLRYAAYKATYKLADQNKSKDKLLKMFALAQDKVQHVGN